MNTQQFVDQFKEPIVRDLAWTLHSNPLLNISEDSFQTMQPKECREISQAFLPTLIELDKNPTKLHAAVEPDNARLGIYFERLIKFWLENQNRFNLIAHNLKVEDNKITIGEFDFIIKDNLLNEVIHWEVAVKFYLGINACNANRQFYGPGKKDRLDIKTDRLMKKQIQLSNHPAAKKLLREKGIKVDKRILFVKGRLFYPSQFKLNPTPSNERLSDSHLRSLWYTTSDFLTLKTPIQSEQPVKQQRYHIADRDEWLTLKSQQGFTLPELKLHLASSPLERPTIIIISENNKETKRFFLVPNDWGYTLSK